MRRSKAANPFAAILHVRLDAVGLSAAEFARRVGLKPSTLNMMRYRTPAARRAPSREKVEEWGRVLGLSGDAFEAFWWSTQLLYAPTTVQEYVDTLRATTHRVGRSTRVRRR